ncbi:hypothetical protein HAX54_027283 [Datura stramonium]|uniref:Uncharacterized protein n=1 Tax=Datura stramonium TaxID=4076 RepID=A0ABS8V4Y7_DATST|nr:hypothetical protein [Datura stramonium]
MGETEGGGGCFEGRKWRERDKREEGGGFPAMVATREGTVAGCEDGEGKVGVIFRWCATAGEEIEEKVVGRRQNSEGKRRLGLPEKRRKGKRKEIRERGAAARERGEVKNVKGFGKRRISKESN